MAGILYLVATPIGNLEDITARALRVLAEVDLVAAEDTRVSGRLLHHFAIEKPLVSYYEQNKRAREGRLLAALQEGKNIALISDAGTPGLSDPGADLVKAAIRAGIEVVAIPGASALLTALTASGLEDGAFCFEGFLPRDGAARRKRLAALSNERRVLVFYEAPHRLCAVLEDMAAAFGPQRAAVACRELTKLHEEKLRGTLAELQAHFHAVEPRGEFTLVIAGAADAPVSADAAEVAAAFQQLLAQGMPRRQAAREIATRYGVSAREIYAIGLAD